MSEWWNKKEEDDKKKKQVGYSEEQKQAYEKAQSGFQKQADPEWFKNLKKSLGWDKKSEKK